MSLFSSTAQATLMHSASPKSLPHFDWPAILGDDCLGLDAVELDQLSVALFEHAPRCVRVHPLTDIAQLPFASTAVPWHAHGRWLTNTDVRPGAYLQFAAGDYYIQDAASLLAMTLCRIQPGQIVCDLCAAPGGKATGLLDQLGGTGFLLANEVIQGRLALLETALARSGWPNHATTNLDAEKLTSLLPQQFDCVLVDAPCSGQSMVGRDKQSLAAFSVSQIDHSAARQQRILQAAARLVRPGGRLVYSTCTFAVAENESVIEQFLQDSAINGWSLDPMPELSQWSSPRLPGCYRLWPHRDRCDGGFAAALKLAGPASESSVPIDLRGHKSSWSPAEKRWSELRFLADASHHDHQASLWQCRDQLHLFHQSPWAQLPNICHSGLAIAAVHPQRIEPSYAAAVVNSPELSPVAELELTSAEALAFMRGESLRKATTVSGWCRVSWQGRSLAWGKVAGGSLKNHLPKLLRNPSIQSA